MKSIILFTSFLVLTVTAFGQHLDKSYPLLPEDYRKKSEIQKGIGWVALGGGVIICTIGTAIFLGDILHAENSDLILPAVGLGTALCSIPFFISAGNNKRRAARLSLETQPVIFPQYQRYNLNYQPALTIKIGL